MVTKGRKGCVYTTWALSPPLEDLHTKQAVLLELLQVLDSCAFGWTKAGVKCRLRSWCRG